MITGRAANHAPLPGLIIEAHQRMSGTPDLEGANGLEDLELEQEGMAGLGTQCAGSDQWGLAGEPGDEALGFHDLGKRKPHLTL
jgi:hypothetical protein